jgi:hypothetical protein
MKKIIFLGLLISMIIVSCTKERKAPVEGAWKMVYANWNLTTTVNYQFPGNLNISQIKMLSKEYFTWVGQYKLDTAITYNYGTGSYKLEGNKFEENVLFRNGSATGGRVRILLEIRNDTLIQKWPADENWKLAENYSSEKYVRLK